MEKLSSDILFDILSKQPLRSLGQYKCVNKRWLSVISDPQFAKANLERSGYRPRLLLNTNPIQSVNYELIASSDKNQAAAPHLMKIHHPVKPPGEWSGVFVGSCDGLVCLLLEDDDGGDDDYYYDYDFNSDDECDDDDDDDNDDDDDDYYDDDYDDDDDDDDDGNGNLDSDQSDDDYNDDEVDVNLILWNPTTREHRVLPRPGIHPSRGNFFCGLGYDCLADDYKMLVGQYSGDVVTVEVFALKTNSWRRLINLELDGATKISWEASYCNGCLHWLSTTTNQIITFDMSEERFRTCDQPPVPCPKPQGLGIITGDEAHKLFLHSREWNINGFNEFEIWVNKDDVSWTKVHSLPIEWFVVNKRKRVPITLTGDGKKIVCKSSNGEELYLYDPLTTNTHIDKRVKLGIHYWDTAHSNYTTYVESLVSPHAGRRHLIPKPPPPHPPAASALSSLLIYPRITLCPRFYLHDIVSHLTGLHSYFDFQKNNFED